MISLLIPLLIALIVIGLFFWALQNIPGLPPVVRQVAIVVVCIIAIVWLLGYVMPSMGMHSLR